MLATRVDRARSAETDGDDARFYIARANRTHHIVAAAAADDDVFAQAKLGSQFRAQRAGDLIRVDQVWQHCAYCRIKRRNG
jgi:hypothetical protein